MYNNTNRYGNQRTNKIENIYVFNRNSDFRNNKAPMNNLNGISDLNNQHQVNSTNEIDDETSIYNIYKQPYPYIKPLPNIKINSNSNNILNYGTNTISANSLNTTLTPLNLTLGTRGQKHKFEFELKAETAALSENSSKQIDLASTKIHGLTQLSINDAVKKAAKKTEQDELERILEKEKERRRIEAEKTKNKKKRTIYTLDEISDILPPESYRTPQSVSFLCYSIGIILFSIILIVTPYSKEAFMTSLYCFTGVKGADCTMEKNFLVSLSLCVVCFIIFAVMLIVKLLLKYKKYPGIKDKEILNKEYVIITAFLWFTLAGFYINFLNIITVITCGEIVNKTVSSIINATTLLTYKKSLDYGSLISGLIDLLGYFLNHNKLAYNLLFIFLMNFLASHLTASCTVIILQELATNLTTNFFQESLTNREKIEFIGSGLNNGWFLGIVSGLEGVIGLMICILFNRIK